MTHQLQKMLQLLGGRPKTPAGASPLDPRGLPFLTPPNLTYQFQKHSTVPVKKYYIVSGKKSDTNCVKMTEISYTIPSKFNDPKDDMQ